jgi:hypothetical protein
MTPLAKAHEVLNGDLNNSYRYKIGESTLYWDNRDQTYTTYYGMRSRASLTYISTVEEFINFKGDATQAPVYTQEMADNGVLPSVGMECELSEDFNGFRKGCVLKVYSHDVSSNDNCVLAGGIIEGVSGGVQAFEFHIKYLKPLTPPIELIDGKAYQFDYYTGSVGMNNVVMRYRKSGDYFYFDNTIFERKFCTNIKPLTVEGK